MKKIIKEKKVKTDEIELKEILDENLVHMTKEDNRKIMPKEVKRLKYISNNTQITKYTWESEGDKIINDKKTFFTREEKKILKSLLLKQLPEKYRPNFWLIASGARHEMQNNKDYYKNLSENYPDCIPSPYAVQIDMDLHRTFPSDPYFQKEENLLKLRNILLAYSRRNISIGYCQGFNFIVGRLLKVYSKEEEAFWVFVQLIEHILPINYYSELAGIMIDCSILMKLVKLIQPMMYDHLLEIGYELSLNNLLYKWLVSLFIQNLSLELSLIVWDLLFLEGSIILFKSALGILKIIRKNVMNKESLEDINTAFDDDLRHLNDFQSLIYYLSLRKFEFDNDYICKNRIEFQTAILDTIVKNNENKITKLEDLDFEKLRRPSYVQNVVECFREWPLCIYDTNYKYKVVSFLVFKVHDPPNFIEDYYFDRINCKKTNWNYISSYYGNKSKDQRRKSSKSSEGFCNINIDEEINYLMFSISNSNTNPNSPKMNFDNYEYNFKLYYNLLIERRKHYCPLKVEEKVDENQEILFDGEFRLEDSYIKVKEKEKEKDNCKKTENGKCISQSMMKSSYFFLKSNKVDSQLRSSLNCSEFTDNNMKMLESLREKPLLDLDEFVDEEEDKYYI